MTVEMFQNIETNKVEQNNFFNFTSAPISSNTNNKFFSNDGDYINFKCEYKKTMYSIIFKIITNIIGLYLAYRICSQLKGLYLGVFLFFYILVLTISVVEIVIHIMERQKPRKICQKYYTWLKDHLAVNILQKIIRRIMFLVLVLGGISSFFKNDSKHNLKFLSLKNNRNNRTKLK